MLLRNLRAPDGVFIDLLVEDGTIVAVGLVGTLDSSGETIDCGGRLVFPGFVDAHAHIDKSLAGTGVVSKRGWAGDRGDDSQRAASAGGAGDRFARSSRARLRGG